MSDFPSPDAPSLLFLPGASGNVDFWKPVAERLAHRGARRFMSWPGLGGIPRDPDVKTFDDLVSRVTRAITAPAVLLAQSMGGVVAVRAALERPGFVRGLVLSVTSGGIDMAALGAVDWRQGFSRADSSYPRWFLDDRSDLTARLPEVTVPVLLVWGDADPISPVAVGQRLAGLFPRSRLVVIEGGTHNLVHERADKVAGIIDGHLAIL